MNYSRMAIFANLLFVIIALMPTHGKAEMTASEFDALLDSISNWGRWGQEDQLGALNFITPAKRREAAQLLREGTLISLAHGCRDGENAEPGGFTHRMLQTGEQEGDSASDMFTLKFHGMGQTHLDALCHLFYKGTMYNGFPRNIVTEAGAAKLSVLNVKDGVLTRGVLMDIPQLRGVPFLAGRRPILPSDLDEWEKRSNVRVGAGDAVFIRTGRWSRQSASGPWDYAEDSAGLDASCLRWLHSRDIAILGSDLASDVLPSGTSAARLPVHVGAIWAMGVPILDNCDLERLSEESIKRERWDFMLMFSPLPVEGGTGSPVNPIAGF